MEQKAWPALPLASWEPTYLTLHRWMQIVGKVALALATPLNHWWHVALRVDARGLTTRTMPCGEDRHLTMRFDFGAHELVADTSDKRTESFPLAPMSVAEFFERLVRLLGDLDVRARIRPFPVEVTDATPFPHDHRHASYDPERVETFHRVLLAVQHVFDTHRGRFLGKASPVHFFWGAFDLAVTRFSGRRNPHPPADAVMREAYSHEVISHGFWPGGDWPGQGRIDEPVFYAYAVPEPAGFRTTRVRPAAAGYREALGEHLLPYDAVRTSDDPPRVLLDFMESSYLAAAERAGWSAGDVRDRVLVDR